MAKTNKHVVTASKESIARHIPKGGVNQPLFAARKGFETPCARIRAVACRGSHARAGQRARVPTLAAGLARAEGDWDRRTAPSSAGGGQAPGGRAVGCPTRWPGAEKRRGGLGWQRGGRGVAAGCRPALRHRSTSLRWLAFARLLKLAPLRCGRGAEDFLVGYPSAPIQQDSAGRPYQHQVQLVKHGTCQTPQGLRDCFATTRIAVVGAERAEKERDGMDMQSVSVRLALVS